MAPWGAEALRVLAAFAFREIREIARFYLKEEFN
jgi:hypothetical protein